MVFSGNESHKRILRAGIERILGDGDGGTKCSPWRSCYFLPRGGALFCRRDLPPRPECHQISAGDREAAVACRRVIYHPQRRLDHRGYHCCHQVLTLQGQAPGGI